MPTENDSDHKTESRRILDRVSKEADSSGFAQMRAAPRDRDVAPAAADEADPIDAWATKVGRTLGFIITVCIMLWLVLYVIGKV